jgi:methyltransferase (TIGR00027 family)
LALGERARNPLAPRSTAEAACAMRAAGALEPDPVLRCPDDMAGDFLGGLNVTTLARNRLARRLLIAVANRRAPGAYAYEILRAKFLDEVVLDEVAAGVDELVLLGAGLDSRPYRLADRLAGLRVLEVDHPDTQATKRARLRRLFGREPEHVAFVSVDFDREEIGPALAAAGHDRDAVTLFVWSGVSPYLSERGNAEVLSWVGGHGSPRTSIVFDAIWAEALDGSREFPGADKLLAAVAASGEPMRWGIPIDEVHETLARFGLRAERLLDEGEGRSAYLRRSDGSLYGRPFGFGIGVHARSMGS